MNLPDGFADEYWQMRERFQWAVQRGNDLGVPETKLTVEDLEAFFTRWRGKVGIPEFENGMKVVAEAVECGLRRKLEHIYLLHLRELVEAREDWVVSEHLFKSSTAHIQIMKHAPAQLLPELERIYREHMGCEFDPTNEFRRAEASVVEYEKKYRQCLAEMEVDWSERLSPAIRQRLASTDLSDLRAWMAELDQKLAEIDRK
jgi:hypothetical protein